MGLITHNRIYVCIDASPCPVIVDLVIIGGAATLERHLVGGRRASPGREATPCGLAASNCHLRPSHGRCLCPHAPPLQASAMPAGGRACWRLPLQGGFGHGRPPPYRGPGSQPAWSWVANPAWGLAVAGRSSSSQFLLRMQGGRRIGGGG
ncbi:hypothetical protein B296_00046316 [Ensete ventricosum]|uniref:Uncharacterized protein n=1 Tax=Ensete ventricosum TaxID=4639 RepID=A0A426X992_ENSVE|nr:hypothetical protein B296_00046316 [Ensete ventricosum]